MMRNSWNLAAAMGLILASSTAQAAFIIDQPSSTTNSGNANYGQSFTPADAEDETTGDPSGLASLALTEFVLARGGGSTNAQGVSGADFTQLYLNIYTDTDNNITTTGDLTFIGSSTNTMNYVSTADSGLLTWTFDNLLLDAGTKYFAVLSATNVAGSNVSASLRLAATGNPQPNGGALSNGIESAAADNQFSATFVPEPASLMLLGVAGLTLLARRCRG